MLTLLSYLTPLQDVHGFHLARVSKKNHSNAKLLQYLTNCCSSIFTFFGSFLEVASLWAYHRENPANLTQEKGPAVAGTRAPLDAPAPAAAV